MNEITPAQPAITPMEMLRIAVERDADLDKLSKLMDLQERWEANEARRAYVRAMAAFKASPPTLVKDKPVEYGGGKTAYKHATLDKVSAAIGAALAEHGLHHSWSIEQPNGTIRVSCVLTHEQGHSERVTMEAAADTSGSKNSIQAAGSTVTYLERYTLLAATGLAARDQDDDGIASGKPIEHISAEQKAALIDAMRRTGADVTKFLAFVQVSTLDELPAARFEPAMAALAKKARAAKQAAEPVEATGAG